jgi:hypothetical protein
MEKIVTGKFIIYTQIEHIYDAKNLDILRLQVITTPKEYDTKEEALEEMILTLMEIRNNDKDNKVP